MQQTPDLQINAVGHLQTQEHRDNFNKLVDWQSFVVNKVLLVTDDVRQLKNTIQKQGHCLNDNNKIYQLCESIEFGTTPVQQIENDIKEQTCSGIWLNEINMEAKKDHLRSVTQTWIRNMNSARETLNSNIDRQQLQIYVQQELDLIVVDGDATRMIDENEENMALDEELLANDFNDFDVDEDAIKERSKKRKSRKGRKGGRKH